MKVIANWKMHGFKDDYLHWYKNLSKTADENLFDHLGIAPPFTLLDECKTHQSKIKLGAQNISHLPEGPVTGEISAAMIKNSGADFVILGHSERRELHTETEEVIKSKILNNSIFAVSKSGTVSLQISSSNIPSIIIYKLSFINFMIFKMLVNVKFANIINIINNREVIPELLQNECNADEIYRSVIYLLKNPELIKKQLSDCSKTLEGIRSKTSSSEEACLVLRNYLS